MGVVTRDHCGQNTRRALRHAAPQRSAQPALQAGRPGAERAAFSQTFQLGATGKFCIQCNAVGIGGTLFSFQQRFQCKGPAHPLPGAASRQGGAFHAEVRRFAVHCFHTENGIHDARIKGGADLLHLGGQRDRGAVIGGLQGVQPGVGAQHRPQAQHSPCQQQNAAQFQGVPAPHSGKEPANKKLPQAAAKAMLAAKRRTPTPPPAHRRKRGRAGVS